ncbi:hypothetical protein GCM10009840_11940 [Pseudolysinimonas kribbensis]|jgi:DNA-binding LacI/PurR family transcriptional regulator|uniref:Transcriptional regulator LacI/GalR-like sensor domain-containing protein n=1 Tax=Pseudolysinimonas kribbensis TaxID=433641 RepID=A0ABQ6K6Q3_9MICO|nr:substrate-binding domain-containing protein [Pseudolysinimonas kribbensis]GMA95632.1 hypothetical protein GCM10025881_24560 [Pseudolysinimonas kribbensis]
MNGVGLVLVGDVLAADPVISALVHSLGEAVSEAGLPFLARVVDDADSELDVYHAWHASGAPDAVVVIPAEADDARVALLTRLRIPVVALTHEEHLPGVSAVVLDDDAAADELAAFLDRRGYRDVLYAPDGAGASDASDLRDSAFARLGGRVRALDDATPQAVARAVAEAVAPAAVVAADATAAVAIIAAIRETGRSVPGDAGVLSWNDSLLCRTSDPTITALDRRATEIGRLLGECVLRVTAGGELGRLPAPRAGVAARESA